MKRSARDILDQEFLQVRAKLLEVAAFFDRLDKAQTEAQTEAQPDAEQPIDIHIRQHLLLEQGAAILIDHEPNKAARLQLLFSRDYVPAWREQFEI